MRNAISSVLVLAATFAAAAFANGCASDPGCKAGNENIDGACRLLCAKQTDCPGDFSCIAATTGTKTYCAANEAGVAGGGEPIVESHAKKRHASRSREAEVRRARPSSTRSRHRRTWRAPGAAGRSAWRRTKSWGAGRAQLAAADSALAVTVLSGGSAARPRF